MVKTFKTPAAKRLCSIVLALAMFVSLTLSSSLYVSAEEESAGNVHELTVSAEEVLAAIENGTTPLGESGLDNTTAGEEDISPKEGPAIGESIVGDVPGTSGPATAEASSLGSSDVPELPGSSKLPGSSEAPGTSSAPGDSQAAKDPAPVVNPTEPEVNALIDRIDIPFGSETLKDDLLKHLENNLPVRLFDHDDIGCPDCQALVTVNPETKQVSIIAINASEGETHTFKLTIANKNNVPLNLEDVSKEATNVEKKVFVGDIEDIPDGVDIEILDSTTVQPEDTAPSSSQPAASEDTSSVQSSAPGEDEAPSESVSPPESSDMPVETVTEQKAEPQPLFAAFAAAVKNTFVGDAQGTGPEKTSHEETSDEPGTEEASSDTGTEQTTSSDVSSQESSGSEASSSQDESSQSGSEAPESSEPADDPAVPGESGGEEIVKTTALLLSTMTAEMSVHRLDATPVEVKSGITMVAAAALSAPDLNTIQVSKEAELVSAADRTYKITLKAWAAEATADPADIVLVLDTSASMDEVMDQPTATTLQLSDLDRGSALNTYFVKYNDEFYPIKYFNSNNLPNGYIMANGISYTKNRWYRILINTSGVNVLQAQVTSGTTIYRRKTKLEMLQESAKSFIASVARVSPDSRIAIVTFNESVKTAVTLRRLGDGTQVFTNAINGIQTAVYTRQDLGLQRALSILQGASSRKRSYTILFTDGEPRGNGIEPEEIRTNATNTATTIRGLTNPSSSIYTIGLYGSDITDLTSLESFLISLAGSNDHYYNANNTGLDNVFNSIFSSIANGIPGAVIKDVVNERFSPVGSIPGATVSGDTVTWSNQTIPCTGSDATGWKAEFLVQAKPNYVGGNAVPTNIEDDSRLTIAGNTGFSRKFDTPMVDVPLRFSLDAQDGYFYIGDQLASASTQLANLRVPIAPDWFTHDDTTIAYSLTAADGTTPLAGSVTANTPYKLKAVVTPKDTDGYPPASFLSPQKSLYMLSPSVSLTDAEIFAGEQTNLNSRAGVPATAWQYQPTPGSYADKGNTWVYAGNIAATPPALTYTFNYRLDDGSDGGAVASPPVLALYKNTDFNVTASRTDLPSFDLNTYVRYTNTSKNQDQHADGWFTITVGFGTITVNKQIDKIWAPHGDPIFVYTLERLNANGSVAQSYNDYIRFTDGTASPIQFTSLPAGTYRLTELDTIRYALQSINAPDGTISIPTKSVEFTISSDNRSRTATFINTKVEDRWFSHTDAVKNTFRIRPQSVN